MAYFTVFALKKHGFDLNKDEFCDATALRYNRNIYNLPFKCSCGNNFDVNNVMNCKKEGFVSIRQITLEISKKFNEKSLYRC